MGAVSRGGPAVRPGRCRFEGEGSYLTRVGAFGRDVQWTTYAVLGCEYGTNAAKWYMEATVWRHLLMPHFVRIRSPLYVAAKTPRARKGGMGAPVVDRDEDGA